MVAQSKIKTACAFLLIGANAAQNQTKVTEVKVSDLKMQKISSINSNISNTFSVESTDDCEEEDFQCEKEILKTQLERMTSRKEQNATLYNKIYNDDFKGTKLNTDKQIDEFINKFDATVEKKRNIANVFSTLTTTSKQRNAEKKTLADRMEEHVLEPYMKTLDDREAEIEKITDLIEKTYSGDIKKQRMKLQILQTAKQHPGLDLTDLTKSANAIEEWEQQIEKLENDKVENFEKVDFSKLELKKGGENGDQKITKRQAIRQMIEQATSAIKGKYYESHRETLAKANAEVRMIQRLKSNKLYEELKKETEGDVEVQKQTIKQLEELEKKSFDVKTLNEQIQLSIFGETFAFKDEQLTKEEALEELQKWVTEKTRKELVNELLEKVSTGENGKALEKFRDFHNAAKGKCDGVQNINVYRSARGLEKFTANKDEKTGFQNEDGTYTFAYKAAVRACVQTLSQNWRNQDKFNFDK